MHAIYPLGRYFALPVVRLFGLLDTQCKRLAGVAPVRNLQLSLILADSICWPLGQPPSTIWLSAQAVSVVWEYLPFDFRIEDCSDPMKTLH